MAKSLLSLGRILSLISVFLLRSGLAPYLRSNAAQKSEPSSSDSVGFSVSGSCAGPQSDGARIPHTYSACGLAQAQSSDLLRASIWTHISYATSAPMLWPNIAYGGLVCKQNTYPSF